MSIWIIFQHLQHVSGLVCWANSDKGGAGTRVGQSNPTEHLSHIHNAPLWDRNVHISVPKRCILWDMGQVHWICEFGQLSLHNWRSDPAPPTPSPNPLGKWTFQCKLYPNSHIWFQGYALKIEHILGGHGVVFFTHKLYFSYWHLKYMAI